MTRRKWRRRDVIEIAAFPATFVIVVLLALYSHADHVSVARQQARQGSEQRHLVALAGELRSANRRLGSTYTLLVESCKRLQIVRVEDNQSHYADWLLFRAVLAVVPPGAPFRGSVVAAIAAKSWVPRTDCTQAVNRRGARYKPPRPVPFNQRIPPRSAVTLYSSDFG